jgi:hypothetical protein
MAADIAKYDGFGGWTGATDCMRDHIQAEPGVLIFAQQHYQHGILQLSTSRLVSVRSVTAKTLKGTLQLV